MGLPAYAHCAVDHPAPISRVPDPDDEAARFREAMARVPSGVAIVTTTDAEGRWWGFTASSFCSLSLSPRLILVCLARTAQCHDVFLDAKAWVLHLVTAEHAELARKFATRGADKFAGRQFVANERGLPMLPDYSVAFDCAAHERYDGGDHTILIGEVLETHIGSEEPAVYYRRVFHELPAPGRRYV